MISNVSNFPFVAAALAVTSIQGHKDLRQRILPRVSQGQSFDTFEVNFCIGVKREIDFVP